jgi:thiamine pyrophosphate-dependent acetolactate synthase large subunit-like protein
MLADLSDNPDFVEIAKAYKIHGWRLNEAAMVEYPVAAETGDLTENFLRSPHPELLVFDCAPEANVYPMVPAGAALPETVFGNEST